MFMAKGLNRAIVLSCCMIVLSLTCSTKSYASVFITNKWRAEIAVATSSDEKRLQALSNSISSEINYQADTYKITSIIHLESQFSDGMQAIYQDQRQYTPLDTTASLADHSEFTLRELYIEIPLNQHFLTLGKQQVVWGKADGIKILDVVNPQSFNEFIFDEFEQSRIPLWMLNVEFSFENNDVVQLLWIPDTSVHRLAPQNASYGVTTSRFIPHISESQAPNLTSNDVIQNPYKSPSASIKNSDVGLRWSRFIGGWDISLNYLYHYVDMPVFTTHLQHGYLNINSEYYRSHLLGGSFANTFNNFTLRSEVAYQTNIRQRNINQQVSQYDGFTYLIGVDYFGLSNMLVSAQFIQDHAIDTPVDLTKPKVDTNITLLVRNDFWHETLTSELLVVNNMDQHDGFVRASLNYDYNDNVKLWLASDIIWGELDGLYGQFEEKDRIKLGFEISF